MKSSRTASKGEALQDAVAKAEMTLLIAIADRTKLSTDVLLGLQPMPTLVSPSTLKREKKRGDQLAYLVGSVVEALSFYCTDIEDEYERSEGEK